MDSAPITFSIILLGVCCFLTLVGVVNVRGWRPRLVALAAGLFVIAVLLAFTVTQINSAVGNIFSATMCSAPGTTGSACGDFIQTEVAATTAALTPTALAP